MFGFLTGAFSFLRLRWKAIAVLCVALILAGVIWKWHSDIQAKVRAVMGYEQVTQALKEQKQALREYEEEVQRRRRLNEKYRERLQNIQEAISDIEGDLYDLERQSKKVADWADNRWPDPLVRRLQSIYQDSNASREGANPAPQTMDSADRDAGAASPERNESRAAEGGGGSGIEAPEVSNPAKETTPVEKGEQQ